MSEARYVTTIRLTAAEREKITASGLSITRFMQAAIERYTAADEVCIHVDDPAYGQLVALAAARGQTVTLCGVDPAKLT